MFKFWQKNFNNNKLKMLFVKYMMHHYSNFIEINKIVRDRYRLPNLRIRE